MASLSDAELWEKAAGGSAAAFGMLFERHARPVYNYCFRRTGDWSLAEDLTSAVFLEAWKRRERTALVSDNLLPWLLGVANNLLRNVRRSIRRHEKALERLPIPGDTPDFGDDVAGRVDDEHQMVAILTAIRALPRRDQEVLALCVWQGLSYAETADVLSIPVGTVRSRLSRARRRVRELISSSGHEDSDRAALLRGVFAQASGGAGER